MTEWYLGKTSEKYEVGNGGAATVSSGKGDFGGVSYGRWQLSSKTGTCASFVKLMGYSNYFGTTVPGTSKFTELWKKAAIQFPDFGEKQHEFIRLTHYNTQLTHLKKNGVDLLKRGCAVQDAIWSTSVQFGGNTNLIIKALSNKNIEEMGDVEIVSAIQDYKIANNNALFKSSSSAVKESTLNRAKNEKNDLIKLAKNEPTQSDSIVKNLAEIFDTISKPLH